MNKLMTILTVLLLRFEEFCKFWFTDDEPYEPWMDFGKWQSTRI